VLGVGPFTQQIVRTETQSVFQSEATIPISTLYNPQHNQEIELNMNAAIANGLLTTNSTSGQFEAMPSCSSGNCSWPIYSSLAICSSCFEATENLTWNFKNNSGVLSTWEVSSGQNISLQGLAQNHTLSMTVETFGTWGQIEYLATTFIIQSTTDHWGSNITIGNDTFKGSYAAECRLQFCIQTYMNAGFGGFSNESVIRSVVLIDSSPYLRVVIAKENISFNTKLIPN
jgi:hypothetical protein